MILPGRIDDPIIWFDTRQVFREFLAESRTSEELLDLVLARFFAVPVVMTPQVRAVVTDALSYLNRTELIDQVEANVKDRLSWPDYVQWCRARLDP